MYVLFNKWATTSSVHHSPRSQSYKTCGVYKPACFIMNIHVWTGNMDSGGGWGARVGASATISMNHHISTIEPSHLLYGGTTSPPMNHPHLHPWTTHISTYEPPHLHPWATTSPPRNHHISTHEPPTSPPMSHHITTHEPPHLHPWATTSLPRNHHMYHQKWATTFKLDENYVQNFLRSNPIMHWCVCVCCTHHNNASLYGRQKAESELTPLPTHPFLDSPIWWREMGAKGVVPTPTPTPITRAPYSPTHDPAWSAPDPPPCPRAPCGCMGSVGGGVS